MIGKWQYSLRFLLAEFALFALAMGFTRFVLTTKIDNQSPSTFLPLAVVVGISCWGAAIGGLFGKMLTGIICAFIFVPIIAAVLWPN